MSDDSTFLPFYDRATRLCPVPAIGKLLFSTSLAVIFVGPHFSLHVFEATKEWDWFLAVVIPSVMFLLFHATQTLRSTFPEMDVRLPENEKGAYMAPLDRLLSDRGFLAAGAFFGVLNCLFGVVFGPNGEGTSQLAAIYWAYFGAGFVSGMAAWGIVGASSSLNAFSSRAGAALDFTAPGRCGGTQVLGAASTVFGAVTVCAGVLISIYIVKAPWSNRDESWVGPLTGFWIAFPYLMSAVAVIGPTIGMHRQLRRYKTQTEVDFQNRSAQLRQSLEAGSLAPEDVASTREEYEYVQGLRAELHDMRTWPFSLGSSVKYSAVVLGNLAATILTAGGKIVGFLRWLWPF